MKKETLKSVVTHKQKGAFSSLLWEHELPVRSAYKANNIITKRTSGVVRLGVEYDNIGAVKVGRALGELPSINSGLTWGEWEQYPFFITHKGNHYLRVARAHGTKFRTEYFINGRRATKEECIPYCIASAFKDDGKSPEVFTINCDNILAIR